MTTRDSTASGSAIDAIQPIIHDAIVQAGSGWTVAFERSVAEAIVDKLSEQSEAPDG